jgi:hypothetical protein
MIREEDKQARNWGMLCHLIALCALLGVPFGHILGPLVVWLVKRNDFRIVDEQGKESLNFQISFTIYALVSALLVFFVVGIVLLIGIAIADLILVIIASVRVSNGQPYRYPLTIRFIK